MDAQEQSIYLLESALEEEKRKTLGLLGVVRRLQKLINLPGKQQIKSHDDINKLLMELGYK